MPCGPLSVHPAGQQWPHLFDGAGSETLWECVEHRRFRTKGWGGQNLFWCHDMHGARCVECLQCDRAPHPWGSSSGGWRQPSPGYNGGSWGGWQWPLNVETFWLLQWYSATASKRTIKVLFALNSAEDTVRIVRTVY